MRRSLSATRAVYRTAAATVVLAAAATAGCGGGDGGNDTGLSGFDIEDVGFMTPESVLADTVADVYLVSNINGGPTDKDDNGFISRVSPDGQVLELKWIDGTALPAELHAPKGMAIRGDSLYIADVDCVRVFNRVSGAPVEQICIDGATFLNDVAFSKDGSLFVTDSGLQGPNLEPSGTDAIYRLSLRAGVEDQTIAQSPNLGAPNGIAIGPRGIFVATFGSGQIVRYTVDADPPATVHPESDRQIDGIVFLNDGGFAFSSWGDSAVYHVSAAGTVQPLLTGIESPADIGYDPRRNRILVPLFTQNKVLVRHLGDEPAAGGESGG